MFNRSVLTQSIRPVYRTGLMPAITLQDLVLKPLFRVMGRELRHRRFHHAVNPDAHRQQFALKKLFSFSHQNLM